MLVIKVWCLPTLSQEALLSLFKDIVAAVVAIEKLGVKSENEMLVLFPPDTMTYGLGKEVLVEVDGLPEVCWYPPNRFNMETDMKTVVNKHIPNANVIVHIRTTQ